MATIAQMASGGSASLRGENAVLMAASKTPYTSLPELQAAAQKTYAELVSKVGDAALYQQAEVMAQFGRPDEAFDLLGRARAVGDSGLTALASDPLLDPIVKDPRYTSLIRNLGFV